MRRTWIAAVPALALAGALSLTACGEGRRAPTADAAAAAPGQARLSVVTFRSRNIYCYACVSTIKSKLQELGVTRISADMKTKTMTGDFDPSRVRPEAIRKAVEDLGYPVESFETGAAR